MHEKVEEWKKKVSETILTRMKQLDKNRDGFLTRNEIMPPNPKDLHEEL